MCWKVEIVLQNLGGFWDYEISMKLDIYVCPNFLDWRFELPNFLHKLLVGHNHWTSSSHYASTIFKLLHCRLIKLRIRLDNRSVTVTASHFSTFSVIAFFNFFKLSLKQWRKSFCLEFQLDSKFLEYRVQKRALQVGRAGLHVTSESPWKPVLMCSFLTQQNQSKVLQKLKNVS